MSCNWQKLVHVERLESSPGSSEQSGELFHVGHADSSLFVDDVTTQVLDRGFQLAIKKEADNPADLLWRP